MEVPYFKKEFFADLNNSTNLDLLISFCEIGEEDLDIKNDTGDDELRTSKEWKILQKVWPLLMTPGKLFITEKGETFGGLLLNLWFMGSVQKKIQFLLEKPALGEALSLINKNGECPIDIIKRHSFPYMMSQDYEDFMVKINSLMLKESLKSLPASKKSKSSNRL